MKQKKILAALLCAAMLSLFGCGDLPAEEKPTRPVEDTQPVEKPGAWLLTERTVTGETGNTTVQYTYNEKGLVIRETGAPEGELRYEYNDAGQLTRKDRLLGDVCPASQVLTYDEKGNLLTDTYFENGAETTRQEYIYDENGRLIQTLGYAAGKETFQYSYRYDETGKLQAEYTKGEKGERVQRGFSYDRKDNLSMESWFDHDANELLTTRTYYENGVLAKERRDYPTDFTGRWEEFYYDREGRPQLFMEYAHKVVKGMTEFIYDDQGRLITEIHSTTLEETERFEYTYDENGNLSEQVCSMGGKEVYRVQYTYTRIELPEEDIPLAQERNLELRFPAVTILAEEE